MEPVKNYPTIKLTNQRHNISVIILKGEYNKRESKEFNLNRKSIG